jgi:glyoxylase-like metal-dependent hydrolase (beta-lactamase superfamily II)/rhodanese-related sulfurtransferase
MEIKQFYDKSLAHASYAIQSESEIALIDPERNPQKYYDYAKEHNAKIVAVIETHPHADFVSSHLEISKTTGAKIYVSKLLNPFYEFVPFDEGDELILGKIKLIPLNTPGHSPDSISIIIKDENGNDYAIATGDTLFVGDVGRPDLRESAGAINKKKEDLARMMYSTITEKLIKLPDSMLVYPAHGAGSLCGKATSTETYTTIGKERKENYALQEMSENDFVRELLHDQSFIPKYFGYDVELNRRGAPNFKESIGKVRYINSYDEIEKRNTVIDTRSREKFNAGHFKGALNIRGDMKFETWLGTLVSPDDKFYLISDSEENLKKLVERTAKIGYESNIKGALVHTNIEGLEISKPTDIKSFKEHPENFTIVDVRNKSEVSTSGKIFKDSLSIPLNELSDRFKEIPAGKPVIVHCAGGSRSAAASSILKNLINTEIYDLGDEVKSF